MNELIKKSDVYKMMKNESFIPMTDEEILESESGYYFQNVEEITNEDELNYIVESINYWGIKDIPDMVFDYLKTSDYTPDSFLQLLLNFDYQIVKDFIPEMRKYLFDNKLVTMIEDIELKFEIFQTKNKIACGLHHSVAINKDDNLLIWGNYRYEDTEFSRVFVQISRNYERISQIFCVGQNTIALDETGKIFLLIGKYHATINRKDRFIKICCGYNYIAGISLDKKLIIYGLLVSRSVRTIHDENFIDLTSNINKIFALTENYEIRIFDEDGRKIIHDINDVIIHMKCSTIYLVLIKDDFTLLTYESRIRIKKVFSPDGKFTRIACMKSLFFGIREDGFLVVWNKNEIVSIIEESFKDVACGKEHVVLIKENGTLHSYDVKTNEIFNVPEGIFVEIACGDFHSVGMREDGKIITWYLDGRPDDTPTEHSNFVKNFIVLKS